MALTPEQFAKLKNQLTVQKTLPKVEESFMSGIKGDVKNRFSQAVIGAKEQMNTAESAFDSGNYGEASKALLRSGVRVLGATGNAVGDTVGRTLSAVTPDAVEQQVGETLAPAITPVLEKYNKLKETNPQLAQDIEDALGITELLGVGLAKRPIKAGIDAVQEATGKIVARSPKIAGIPDVNKKVVDFLSQDPDIKTSTILQETPTVKFDKYIEVGEQASKDPRKLTPYEVAGEEAQKALLALDKRMKGIGQQKSSIIQKAKVGTIDMAPDVRESLRAINKSFKGVDGADRALVERVFTKLKTASRLQDVDRVIDEIQDIIYADAKNTTLSLGRDTTKKLRAIIEELNGKVKTKAGGSYGELNAKYSNYIKQRDYLNRVLGEKVNGTAVKGGSLVKRFFSPSDAGTKQLFEFLKKELNIDLAQDVTTARFVMELFNDSRARALLDGVPTTPRGLIEKGVDVLVDKTGLGKKVQSTLRESELRKARSLTK